MAAQGGSVKVPAAQIISTRDGTLLKDSKMVNCFMEPTPEGKAAVKRPGTTTVAIFTVGAVPQGQFLLGDQPFCIQNDIVYDTVAGIAYPIPSVTTPGQTYSVLSDAPFGTSMIKSASGLWRVLNTSGTPVLTKITAADYPALTVAGIVYLDGTYYVMNSIGEVYGSALQDPLTWPALNFVSADATLGLGAGITRHLNYIVAFYTHGTQFYYDAGLTPGLPIASVGNAAWTTGCGAGGSIREASDVTFFLSKTRQYGRTVSKFEGLSLSKISTPFIERILNLSTLVGMSSFNIKIAGHTFYGFTLPDQNITLVYDVIFDDWHVWTSVVNGVEQDFVGVNYLGSGTQNLFQDTSTGNVIAMDPNAYTDSTGAIRVLIRTPNYTWGTEKRKRYAALFLAADTVVSTASVRYTDNDYQTFSTYRPVALSGQRKMLQRCGMSRMRAWDIAHTDNTPFRLFDIEINLLMADS